MHTYFCGIIRIILHTNPPCSTENCKGPILQSWIIHDVHRRCIWKSFEGSPRTGKSPLFLPLAFTSARPRFFSSGICECTRRADVLKRDDSPAVQEPGSAPCVEFTTRSWSFTHACNDLYRIYSSLPSWAGRIRRDVWLTVTCCRFYLERERDHSSCRAPTLSPLHR